MVGYYYSLNEVALEESFATSLEAGAILIPDVCLETPRGDAQMRTYALHQALVRERWAYTPFYCGILQGEREKPLLIASAYLLYSINRRAAVPVAQLQDFVATLGLPMVGAPLGRNDLSQLERHLDTFFAQMLGRPLLPDYQSLVTFPINIMARHCRYACGEIMPRHLGRSFFLPVTTIP